MEQVEQNTAVAHEEINWTTHPMMESPRKAAIFWAVFVLVLVAVWIYTHEWIFVILSGVILFGSLRGFVLPTRYKLDRQGLEINRTFYKVRKSWSDFRSYTLERNGVFLSPFSVKHRMENFRGVFVPTGDNRQQVIALVSNHLQKME